MADVDNAKLCADAWKDFGDLAEGLAKPVDPRAKYRSMKIVVFEADDWEGSGSYLSWIEVDTVSAERILPLVRDVLAARLGELGVEIPAGTS